MKTTIITEFVHFKALESTTNAQLVSKLDDLNAFQKKLDGFIDAELVENVKDYSWNIIYHYENLEKVQSIGAKLRSSREFADFTSVIDPGSLSISFHSQYRNW